MSLKDKVAIVTGAGKGIGEATAIAMADAGAKVVLAGYRDESINGIQEAITAKGGEAVAVRTDVSKWEDAQNMVKTAIDKYGRVDILVNNAGMDKQDPTGKQFTIPELDDDDWNMVLGVNLMGQVHCSKAVMQTMIDQKWGRIVNVASSLGFTPGHGSPAYGASKAAIINFTKKLAMHMGPHNVCVNCVAPGMVRTPMQRFAPPEEFEMVARMVPLRKVSEASDVAHVILFFCSDPLMVTGQTLIVDGGGTMR